MKYGLMLVVAIFSFYTAASGSSAEKNMNDLVKIDTIKKESGLKRVLAKQNYKKALGVTQKIINTEKIYKVSPLNKQNSDGLFVSRKTVTSHKRGLTKSNQQSESPILRSKTVEKSTRAIWFDIYDSWTSLDYDLDNDGYFSEFTLNFDADFHDDNSSNPATNVYAKIYTSLEGGEWTYLFTSENFTLYSTSPDDYYSVSFELNYDFPSAQYDVLIDLYEVGYAGIVVTAGPDEDIDLYSLPLEDKQYELISENTVISYVASDIYTDRDHDGYYTQLTLEYDIDTYDSGRTVYAEIEITDSRTQQQYSVFTDDFILGTQTEFIDIDFANGYNASFYNFKILLIDVYTGQLLTTASSQNYSSLYKLPIESNENDYSDSTVDVHVSGGGSFGLISFLALLLLIVFSRKKHYEYKI